MKFLTSKRGQSLGPINYLIGAAVLLVVLFVVAIVAANIITSIGGTQTANSAAANISTQGEGAILTFGDNFNVIVVIVVAAGLISLIIGGLAGFVVSQGR